MPFRTVKLIPLPSVSHKSQTYIDLTFRPPFSMEAGGEDPTLYRNIYTNLERAMKGRSILGNRLQGISAQHRLAEAITDLQEQGNTKVLLKDLNMQQDDLRAYLKRLAQTINHNNRRRARRSRKKGLQENSTKPGAEKISAYRRTTPPQPRSPSPDDLSSGSSATARVAQPEFASTTIIVHQRRGATKTYRPHDFCSVSTRGGKIQLDDLRYSVFVRTLGTELGYKSQKHLLFYNWEGSRQKIEIDDDRSWKAALAHMYSNGNHLKIEMTNKLKS